MKFGVHLGSRGVAGHPDSLTNVVRKAEAVGFTHLGISDHVFRRFCRRADSNHE